MRSLLRKALLGPGVALLILCSATWGQARPQLTAEAASKEFNDRLNEGKAEESEAIARRLLAQEAAAYRPESEETQRGLDLMLEIFTYRANRSTG